MSLCFAVARLATEQFEPLVSQMDENGEMDPSVRQALFDNGVSLFDSSSRMFVGCCCCCCCF